MTSLGLDFGGGGGGGGGNSAAYALSSCHMYSEDPPCMVYACLIIGLFCCYLMPLMHLVYQILLYLHVVSLNNLLGIDSKRGINQSLALCADPESPFRFAPCMELAYTTL